MHSLDRPERVELLRRTILAKPALRQLYRQAYERFGALLRRCPADGLAVELGSGGGFVKRVLPEVLTTDVVPYPGLDEVVDARSLPFPAGGLRAVLLLNVFHHIPDVGAFLREVERCLAPGGRALIVDQHVGWLSTPIYRYLHHEPFDPDAARWQFGSSGPLSSANGALAWIVFRRDRAAFERLVPQLELVDYRPHTPLRYWLAGGLRSWSLLPGWAFGIATAVDRLLSRMSPELASFVDVELVRRGEAVKGER